MPYLSIREWDVDWSTHLSIDDAIGETAPEGLILHAAGPSAAGTRIVGVWESKEHMTRFFEGRVVPVLASLGIEPGRGPISFTEFDVEIVRT